MRKTVVGLVGLLVPLVLSGCGASSSVVPSTAPTSAPGGPVSDAGWIVTEQGKATKSPAATKGTGANARPSLPPVTFLPVDPSCPKDWTVEPVLIPMTITPAAGSLTVTWPRQRRSNYRITAVPQALRTGSQPDPVWQDVAAGAGCTVTATIRGLARKAPYVIWLDAPNTGFHKDGTRHPYAGESGVVYTG